MDIQPEPDSKDWTWVLRERCPACGFDAGSPDRDELAPLVADIGQRWVRILETTPETARRPAPAVWSPLEYGCHVRDVFDLAVLRVRLMLEQDGPAFANWDQDATAIEQDYATQEPSRVGLELGQAADAFARLVADVPDDAWQRTGLRGDGAQFTVESFVRYLAHDPIHHLTDVTGTQWS